MFMTHSLLAVSLYICLLLALADANDKLSYLAYLLKQKQSIENNIHQIEVINSNLQTNLKSANTQTYQQRVIVSAIRDQSSLLVDAIGHSFISLAQKTSNCSNNGNSNNTEIISKINEVQTQLKKIEQAVNSQMSCERNDYIKDNYAFYQKISDGLKQQVSYQCTNTANSVGQLKNIPFLDINNTKFVPNEKTNFQWVYGQITPQEYRTKSLQLINLYGAAACPESTPFLDENNNCKSCENGLVYDISLKKCRTCDSGTVYNNKLHSCSANSNPYNSNLAKSANLLGNAPAPQPGLPSCPDGSPFFDGKSCISCSLPSYFSFQSNSCTACQNGSAFDITSKSCITNSFFMSNLSSNQNYIGSPLSPLPYDNIQTCSSEQPFSNGKQCFPCKLPQFYNFERMSCQSCPNEFSFDVKAHSCIGTNANNMIMNSNLIDNRNFYGKIPLFNNLFKNCEASTPFFNGKECIGCTLPSYFNFDVLACSHCQDGLTFNIIIQTCEYIKQDFYTSLQVKILYYNGNFDNIKILTDQKKSNNSNMKVCPDETPFYNSRSNSCIQCSNDLPLFDLKNNKCMGCPPGSQFSGQSHICLTRKISATIQRMIMNTA